jgi:hypothetical protein
MTIIEKNQIKVMQKIKDEHKINILKQKKKVRR